MVETPPYSKFIEQCGHFWGVRVLPYGAGVVKAGRSHSSKFGGEIGAMDGVRKGGSGGGADGVSGSW
jgi:hypothetical protein